MAHCIKSKEGCLPFTQAAQVEILNIKIELKAVLQGKLKEAQCSETVKSRVPSI